MGSCCSKKNTTTTTTTSTTVPILKPPEKPKSELHSEKKKPEQVALVLQKEEESVVKKEIFFIKHRNSHEIERQHQRSSDEELLEPKKPDEFIEKGRLVAGAAPVRTSSCTKEEVDAILIQCGRLSRSSSTGKAGLSSENGGRKYSGSKRSYDFDNENGRSDGNNVVDGDDDVVAKERENRRRERQRQSPGGRRRTPSRERDQAVAGSGQQRSGSRERGSGSGGRRVSRSPGRRSESPITTTNSNSNVNTSANANANPRPGKMVSVPATVSSLGGEGSNQAGGVKRIQVKRNVGGDGSRTGASPRARSPARMRGTTNDNLNNTQNQQPGTLSRSNSRKGEHSPYRRNPLAEIDSNIVSQAPAQKTSADNKTNTTKLETNPTNKNAKTTHEQQPNAAETKVGPHGITSHVGLNVISSGPESLKHPQAVARSRSSRLSRDLDISPETLLNPPQSSYTALLLEDIQNFHQKNNTPPSFALPACVTKACSILEAVADLNSSSGSNLSSTFSEDRRRNLITEQVSKLNNEKHPASVAITVGKTKPEMREPFLESEIVIKDDLMEPSFHKYVTVTRGVSGGEELEEEESSGSNSYAGSSQQQWLSSSGWEPNSAESTDRWTTSSSSTSGTRQKTEVGRGVEEGGKRLSAKKRDFDHQQNGNGRGRIGSRGPHIVAPVST